MYTRIDNIRPSSVRPEIRISSSIIRTLAIIENINICRRRRESQSDNYTAVGIYIYIIQGVPRPLTRRDISCEITKTIEFCWGGGGFLYTYTTLHGRGLELFVFFNYICTFSSTFYFIIFQTFYDIQPFLHRVYSTGTVDVFFNFF